MGRALLLLAALCLVGVASYDMDKSERLAKHGSAADSDEKQHQLRGSTPDHPERLTGGDKFQDSSAVPFQHPYHFQGKGVDCSTEKHMASDAEDQMNKLKVQEHEADVAEDKACAKFTAHSAEHGPGAEGHNCDVAKGKHAELRMALTRAESTFKAAVENSHNCAHPYMGAATMQH